MNRWDVLSILLMIAAFETFVPSTTTTSSLHQLAWMAGAWILVGIRDLVRDKAESK